MVDSTEQVAPLNGRRVTFGLMMASAMVGVATTACAEVESPTKVPANEEVPLTDDDLEQITAQVLAKNPVLASSSGIKFAYAQKAWSVHIADHIDMADIIYFPHTETAGFREAFQVACVRQRPEESWSCEEAGIRAYLKLETQAFEVRVTGNISSDIALALVAATRPAALSSEYEGPVKPDTAVSVRPYHEGFHVTWGTPEGYQSLITEAILRDDGDPANPNDWDTNVYRIF